MALPILSAPEYTLALPSSGEKLKYRPFLIKEQKILMLAEEGKDEQESINAIKQIIKNCCLSKGIDIDALPLFDIEYIFLQLRSKSVGEKVTLYFRHQQCPENENKPSKNQTEIQVDLSKVKVQKDPKHNNKIQLTKDVGIIMGYPKIEMIDTYQQDVYDAEAIFKVISNCIDQIYDADETYSSSDYTPQELDEFISSMTEEQFQLIRDFFDTMPALKHKVKFTCVDCNFEENIEVQGIQNFFI